MLSIAIDCTIQQATGQLGEPDLGLAQERRLVCTIAAFVGVTRTAQGRQRKCIRSDCGDGLFAQRISDGSVSDRERELLFCAL